MGPLEARLGERTLGIPVVVAGLQPAVVLASVRLLVLSVPAARLQLIFHWNLGSPLGHVLPPTPLQVE